jgi:Mrp family chromosome partitioning ATPase
MNDTLAAHFQSVRARIEAEIKPHTIIMITSAKADDGARLTAFGLAECLAAAGHSTAVIDATANPGEAIDGRFKTPGRREFPIYALPNGAGASSRMRDTFDAFTRRIREEFVYTIVDAPPFGLNSVTVTLAGVADAVILTLREGREPCKGDEHMIRALALAGAHVLGVIAASPASSEHFESLGATRYVTEPRPRPVVAPVVNGTVSAPDTVQIHLRQAR